MRYMQNCIFSVVMAKECVKAVEDVKKRYVFRATPPLICPTSNEAVTGAWTILKKIYYPRGNFL